MNTIFDLIPTGGDNRFRPEAPSQYFFAGLDLGQRRDHTALCILERKSVVTGEFDHACWQHLTRVEYSVRHVGRMPLDTPYTGIAEDVARRLEQPPFARATMLAVDATGVGLAVVDHLKSLRPPCRIVPVMIGAGGAPSWHRGVWTVPRQELIANMQIMLESRGFGVSGRARHARLLEQELAGFGAAAPHDDLVFATALALFLARHFKSIPR